MEPGVPPEINPGPEIYGQTVKDRSYIWGNSSNVGNTIHIRTMHLFD